MSREPLHSLLRRQIRRHFGDRPPPECEAFISAVDDAYREADRDRALLERSLELSSDELVEANESLRAVFAASPDLYLWLSPTGEVRRVQCSDSEDLHEGAATIVGARIWDVPDPDVAERFEHGCARIRGGDRLVCFEYQLGVLGGRRDYEARMFPLPTGEIMVVVRNISDRKRAEEERFRQVAENIDAVFWMTDPSKRTTLYVSPAYERVWGRTVASLFAEPMSFVDAIHPDDRARVLAAMDRQVEGTYDEEYRVVRPDGSIRWVRDRAFPVRDDDGRVYRVTGLAADITQAKNHQAQIETLNDELEARVEARTAELAHAAESLRQAQKMEAVGRLAGGVAHDFNNLLAVILSYAELALDSVADDSDAAEDIGEIRDAAERAASLTRELLAFSRRQVRAPSVLDLNDVVRDTDRLLARLIREDITLTLSLADELPAVLMDRGQLGQILMNLVVNARDAMPRGGELTVSTRVVEQLHGHGDRPAGRYVCLDVRDTGSGIAPEAMPHLFEPFFTTKAEGAGTGLGLSTVFGIVKQSQGFIDVDSAPGSGARFTVMLPARAGAADDAEPAAREETATSGCESILVVEDEPTLCSSIRRILERGGYTVHLAHNGVEALALVRDTGVDFDLLLTDVVMPEMGGRELHEALAELRPDLRTLFMSGYTDDQLVLYGVAAGTADLLPKPFSSDELLRRVRERLGAVTTQRRSADALAR